MNGARIYLDNAATSWPKPETVYQAVDHYVREVGAAAGRGAYRTAGDADRVVTEARAACAKLLGVGDPARIAFASNGTDALNLAIHGILRPGDHVVTTIVEHNSVLRPLSTEAKLRAVEVDYVDCDATGYVEPQAIANAIRPNTRLVVVTHASNVTGAIQPIGEITHLAHPSGALVLVDGAQTAGCVPIDVTSLELDLFAAGGHKGLLGPLGTGLLYVRPGLEDQFEPMRQGGTGTESSSPVQPQVMPHLCEAGNLNVPALAGLAAAAEWLADNTVKEIAQHSRQLTSQLLEGLAHIEGVQVFGPTADQPRVGVVSFTARGYDPQEFAACLDASCGIECRAGLHCAPRMHEALGTLAHGGLVRLSPGWNTTADEIEQALAAITELAAVAP